MSTYNLEGIKFESHHPASVSTEDYGYLREIEQKAFAAAIPELTADEVDSYAKTNDFDSYVDTRKNPQLLVDRGLARPNQAYSHPMMVIARKNKLPVGYVYTASNVSGRTAEERINKQRSLVKNHKWFRVMAVDPDFQGRGIAHGLAYRALARTLPGRPMSAYSWPKLLPQVDGLLRHYGVEPTNQADPDIVYPFGENGQSRAVEQLRYAHRAPQLAAIKLLKEARLQGVSLREGVNGKGAFGRFMNELEHEESERRYIAGK